MAVRRFKSPRAWATLFVNDTDVPIQENFTMPELNGEESCWTFEWDQDQNISYGNLANFTMILDKHESKLLYLTNWQ